MAVSAACLATADEPAHAGPGELWMESVQCGFDIQHAEGLSNLVRMADLWIDLSRAEEAQLEASRKKMLEIIPLREMPTEQLQKYFSEPEDYLSSKDRRGFTELRRLADKALHEADVTERARYVREMFEVAAAVDNNHRPVVPVNISISQVPALMKRSLHNPVCEGKRPAANVCAQKECAQTRLDPDPSEFWRPVPDISSQDLYAGYGRQAIPDLTSELWNYEGPKTGPGISPGFQAERGKTRIKIKFHEITSEPFTARIFAALGYHVDPVDYVPFLKIRYDRRLLRELHLRHESPIPVKVFGITMFRFHYQPRFDPFDFISGAVLKDSKWISGRELKARLFLQPGREHPESDPGNFRPEIEQQIDYLITGPASVQVRRSHMSSIGPWDFGELGHENLRELRGAGLVAAWLNWCDAQFQNTRVRLIEDKNQRHYENYFCDLGGGMGNGTGLFFRRYEAPNDLDWSFTKAGKYQGQGRMTVPFRIVGYKPVDDTAAFKEMTTDDARWMARMIGQLTERQLLEALIASGFDSAQAKIFLEKLISRRDRMILDLGLANETALLRPDGPQTDYSYDPREEGPLRVRTTSGQIVQAEVGEWMVQKGRVVLNPMAEATSESKTPAHEPQILSFRNE